MSHTQRDNLVFLIYLFRMKMLFPYNSSSSHYSVTGGMARGMVIA
ncbi:MAG: hypothetical protein ACJ703_05580 [Nitrososphaera sp.]